MKLPSINIADYSWDGDSSTLRSYIRKWTTEFGYHSANEIIPFIRQLIPEDHRWRLNKVTTFKGAMKELLVLTSSEDVYIEKIISEIYMHPYCSNYQEDKEFLLFLSKKVNQLIDIQPNHHISAGACCAFLSKLHCEAMTLAISHEFEFKKKAFKDPEGHMSYADTLQEVILNNLKLIDKQVSSRKVGFRSGNSSSDMAQYAQANQVSSGKVETRKATYVPGKGIPKLVPKLDCMGNKLWDINGKQKMETIYVQDESAKVNWQNVPKNSDSTKPPMAPIVQTPQTPQGAQGTDNPPPNPNKSKCLVCKGDHFNLVLCPKLKSFIPQGSDVQKLPKSLCTKCLNTITENGKECKHVGQKHWKRAYCKKGDMCYILCKNCP